MLVRLLRRAFGRTREPVRALDAPQVRYERALRLESEKRLSEAIAEYRALLDAHPRQAPLHRNLANCLSRLGRASEATAHYRAACELDPTQLESWSSMLGTLNYDPDAGSETVAEAHRAWGRRMSALQGEPYSHASPRVPKRRLRIGYVSPDLKRHPVTYLFAPALTHHDHSRFEIVCYDNLPAPDAVTARLRAASDRWHQVAGLSDRAFCEQVRADGIDILVDLAGHTTHSRVSAFALKPAPVQVSWLGYFNTTGLEAVDYFVTDLHSSPPGQERYFTERLLRLPHTRFCYEPPEYAPPVAPLPARRSGRITFGCFNHLSKVNDRVFALWRRVLEAVPGSRLRLMAVGLHDAGNVEHVRTRLAAHGMSDERVELRPFVPHAEMLSAHAETDIALDPFPFGGGMTSLEALWMGVPIVTLAQPLIAGRQTLCFLSNSGLDDLVAADEVAYVAIAQRLASDLDALGDIRASLRARMKASPLMDAAAFTRALEDGYQRMWQGA